MTNGLEGVRVAILVADGFEEVELTRPRKALEQAGAQTFVVSPSRREVQGWNDREKSGAVSVDVDLDSADPADYHALLLPGGVMNPDHLRMLPLAVKFVKAFADGHKPIAAICHGPWMLVEADIVRGSTVTSWPSLKTDLINAGAEWVDQAVVRDDGLVTSRKPDDIPVFNQAMIKLFAK